MNDPRPPADGSIRRLAKRLGGRVPLVVAVTACSLALISGGLATAAPVATKDHQVGTVYPDGEQVSDNQVIQPVGSRLVTQTGKFMGSTVSPDGTYLAATSTDKSIVLQIFNLKTYKQVWTVGSSGANQTLADGTVGQEGPTYSPDGKFLWLPEATGLERFPVNADGSLGAGVKVAIPTVGGKEALTAQSVYSPDGTTLYVAVNGQNTVDALDPATGAITHTWNVGIAPRELKFVGSRLYVSDEGGRFPNPGETTLGSYGTQVPANPYLGTSTTGIVSVIDTADASAAVSTINVQLHPTALYRDGSTLYVANTNSDTISVIDTRTNTVVQTIATQPWSGSTTGYEPTSIALQGDHLLVTLGRANAVAVYTVNRADPRDPAGFVGLLPTDYFPETLATANGQVVVTNTRGIDARGPELTFNKGQGTTPATGHGTHSTTGSLTKFTLPSDSTIAKYTKVVFAQNGWNSKDAKQAKGRTAAPSVIPAAIGDPSKIKHVFLLVKENRSYDQVYGDMKQGNGDAALAQFGAKVTPNQHALASQFGLYDNTYDIGTNSAEGHNWLMQGDDPAYTETSAGEYTRSYDTEEDVLGHQRTGFLWTSIESAGKTAKNYGEFEYGEGKPAGATWQQYYCAATSVMNGGSAAQLYDPSIRLHASSAIPSLNAITDPNSPPFDTSIPDIYRYGVWNQDFQKNGPADFNMMWLSSDHTGGTADPEAQVADGDLAVGQIVDTISHSKYWKDSAIFVVEDDSQDGADHIDGHRAPIQVISPYAVHGKTVSTFYSQINIVRTIQQILGAQPLNQKVAAATPMYDAFTNTPNLTPFTAVRNQVPLTEGVVTPPSCGLDTLGKTGAAAAGVDAAAAKAASVPASEKTVAAQWEKWSQGQHLTGSGGRNAVADYADPALMNRWTWYQTHNWSSAYPGDNRIYGPTQVPGVPAGSINHDGDLG